MHKWFLPKLTDYWNTDDRAQHPLCEAVLQAEGDERSSLLQFIGDSITEHVRVLSDEILCKAALVMVDDLYKLANNTVVYDTVTDQYLAASAGVFTSLLLKRGYLIHYVVDNEFPNTEIGMERLLDMLPSWFRSIGLVYICPQQLA